jgi:hypothetical protein
MSRLFLLLLLSASACKTAIAPANDDYFLGDEIQGRTDMGIRTTLTADGLLDAVSIGHHPQVQHPAFGEVTLAWVETTALGDCDRRVRTVEEDWDGLDITNADLHDCKQAGDESFAADLHLANRVTIAGSEVLDGWRTLRDSVVNDHLAHPERAVATWSGEKRTTVAIGRPGSVLVSTTRVDAETQDWSPHWWSWEDVPLTTIEAPIWMSEEAGFGASVHLLEDLLVIGVRTGGYHVYARQVDEDGTVQWSATDAPAFDEVHAVHDDLLLVERSGFEDLEVLRYADGNWSTAHVLRGAVGGYDGWVMDEVAAFAAVRRDGRRRGVVDRWSLQTGELDASLSLVRPHDEVQLALDGNTLLISELGDDGAVHLLDWTEARTDLFAASGELFHGVCQIPDSSMSEPLHLPDFDTDPDDSRDVFHVRGDAGRSTWSPSEPDHDVWYGVTVDSRTRMDIRLANALRADASPPQLRLHVGDQELELEPLPAVVEDEPFTRYEWYNFGDDDVDATLQLENPWSGRPCRAYDLQVELARNYNYCYDRRERWNSPDPRPLLDESGEDQTISTVDATDTYTVDLAVGDVLHLDIEGDVETTVLDATGERVSWSYGWDRDWPDHDEHYEIEPGFVGPFELRVETYSWTKHRSCTPYVVHAAVTLAESAPQGALP